MAGVVFPAPVSPPWALPSPDSAYSLKAWLARGTVSSSLGTGLQHTTTPMESGTTIAHFPLFSASLRPFQLWSVGGLLVFLRTTGEDYEAPGDLVGAVTLHRLSLHCSGVRSSDGSGFYG